MKGMLLIPDISGFTRFVEQTEPSTGAAIVRELLNTVLENNSLPVELSEIEGDALLFYKIGTPIPLDILFDGITKMNNAFLDKFNELREANDIPVELTLKFIVHFGQLNVYNLQGFTKLYGKAVIESHSLLKNGHAMNSYILVTNEYLDAAMADSTYAGFENNVKSRFSKSIGGTRELTYSFFDIYEFTPELSRSPVAA